LDAPGSIPFATSQSIKDNLAERQGYGLGHISVFALQHKVPRRAAHAYQQAVKLAQQGNHEAAAAQFEAAIRYDAKFAGAYNSLGIEYARLGRLKPAQTALMKASELDPQFWPTFYNLGIVSFLAGDLPQAERQVRQAIALQGSDVRLHILLACLLSLNDETGADAIAQLQFAARKMKASLSLPGGLAGLP
jgi:Flp pilus assembly protein TadD